MGLWLLLLASLGALVWALARSFPDAVRTRDDWTWVAQSLLVILLVSTWLFRAGRGAFSQNLRHMAIWLALIAVLAVGVSYRDELAGVPQHLRLAFGTGYPIPTAEHEVTVAQDARGAFVLNARVNGQPVRFMVDTGATDTVLAPDVARRLGADLDKLKFVESAETANGMGYGAAYVARSLEVGPIAFKGFPMVVNQTPMSTSLLGLSFLNRLDSFEIRDRKLILKWREGGKG
jgi:aspartyl protease family protein